MTYNTTSKKMIGEWAADTTGELTAIELSKVTGGEVCNTGDANLADRAIGVWCNLMGHFGFTYQKS